MKILFFISIHSHGRGGHVHSLNHISKKIAEENEVRIITIGSRTSSVIESNPTFTQHIHFNGLNFHKLKSSLNKIIHDFTPDIYHCFDVGAYNVIRILISSKKQKIVLNKCGGSNPRYFPSVHNLILFSFENMHWFNNKKKFNKTNIHLIPNRVKALDFCSKFQPVPKNKDEFIFVRICRIGNEYKKSIEDSINLIKLLISKNILKVKLYIIGEIENKYVFSDFQNDILVKSGYVVFLTDTLYTNEASRMLYLADAVIGTGRGLMEATSLGKPILTIDKNGEIPVLLNEERFDDAFNTNFSERNVFNKLNSKENILDIEKLIKDKESYNSFSKFAIDCFDRNFSVNRVTEYYMRVYLNSSKGNRNLIADFLLIILSIRKFYLKSKLNKHK